MVAACCDYLAGCLAELGDRAGGEAAIATRRRVVLLMRDDPFRRFCGALDRAHPIGPDDPLWSGYVKILKGDPSLTAGPPRPLP